MIATLVVACIAVIGVFIWVSYIPSVKIYSHNRIATNKKVIALTFDDGPHPEITPKILDILKKNSVKATFFVVGQNATKYPKILSEAFEQGHQIANHSNRHSYSIIKSPRSVLKDINEANEFIYKIIKEYPRFYRPPYGFRTLWGARAISKAGYKIITWDNMTYDYWGLKANKLTLNILKRSKPGGVIVLHDGIEGMSSGNSSVIDALPAIIKQLKINGYKFVKLNELFNTNAYK